MATVWVDAARCIGCGACLEVCTVKAITMTEGKAYVNAELCRGCEVCLPVCPVEAIQPVLQGEIVTAPLHPLAPVSEPQQPSRLLPSLGETAVAVVVTAGTDLLLRATKSLTQAVGRWLLAPSSAQDAQSSSRLTGRAEGGGRQARRRYRGGR